MSFKVEFFDSEHKKAIRSETVVKDVADKLIHQISRGDPFVSFQNTNDVRLVLRTARIEVVEIKENK